MIHIDLFSGIGGFAYAARQVWPDYRNLFFCDNNTFCQAVLRKNFGQDSLIYGDIREVTVERVIADTELARLEGSEKKQQNWGSGKQDKMGEGLGATDTIPVDLLTGGFPCQPFSAAGKRKGRDDERHLWPEMFRVIKTFKPRWVIGENVRGLVNIENGMALQQVFLDLEGIGYAVQAFIIPACAVNAPHRRDRIWIVANQQGAGQLRETQSQNNGTDSERWRGHDIANKYRHAADAEGRGCGDGIAEDVWQSGKQVNPLGHTDGLSIGWQQNWLEVATRLCRVDDGLSAGVDGLKLSKSKHREERLKALGNAIVPQVVMEIMKAIKLADE